jgi:hypothetical protein
VVVAILVARLAATVVDGPSHKNRHNDVVALQRRLLDREGK